MQLQKFLLTSALYLSLAAPAAVLADERESRDTVGEQAVTETRTHTVGNERLRFTVKERAALERRVAEREKERERGQAGNRDDRHKGKHHQGDHHQDGKQRPLPPGLQKKVARGGELPPGWQKKLTRGEVLPASVYEAGQPIPAAERQRWQLPADPKGTVTLEVDGEVVRVVQNTREIIDILRGAR